MEKEIILPSGFIFKIKQISTVDFSEILSSNDIKKVELILSLGIVDPVISLTSFSSSSNLDNSINIENLNNNDVTFLINEITEYSGFSKYKDINNNELQTMISITCYTFRLRPADLLDPHEKLPELKRLFFDFECTKEVNDLIGGEDKKAKISHIDQEKIDSLGIR